MVTWRALHPRQILHALGAISVHNQASLEPEASSPKSSSHPTCPPRDAKLSKITDQKQRSINFEYKLLSINVFLIFIEFKKFIFEILTCLLCHKSIRRLADIDSANL